MKILFFGDFHFESRSSGGGVSIDYAEPVAEDPLMAVIDSLKARYEDEKISLMVFMGDYGKGKDSSEAKQQAFRQVERFIKKIEEECCDMFEQSENLKDHIVFLDGNHDVSRTGAHHEDFESVFGAYLTPYTQKSGSGIRKYGAPIFDFEKLDLLLACISTTQNAGAHFMQSDYRQIESWLAPLKEASKENYNSILKLLEKKTQVDLGSVTPAAKGQLRSASNKSSQSRSVKIAVSHHPLIQMQHATAAHFETVNGPIFFDAARAKGFQFFVSGHLHEFYCADITSRGKSSALPTATLISVPKFVDSDSGELRFVELDCRGNLYSCRMLTYNRVRDMLEELDVASNEPSNYRNIQGEHTLLDYEIQALVEEGKIVRNGSTDRVQAVSYDCAIGLFYKRYDEEHHEWPNDAIQMEASPAGPAKIKIEPGERVLLYTHEEFCIPRDMVLHASPRASWNRKGLVVDLSFIAEPGFEGPFCFPVTNKNKHAIEISAQEAVMSVSFQKLSGDVARDWKDRGPESLQNRKNKQDK